MPISKNVYVKLLDTIFFAFMPLVHLYYSACSDLLFNVTRDNASGMEKWADELLIPYHFVFEGRKALYLGEGKWSLERRFGLDATFWPKMGLSLAFVVPSFVVGAPLKLLSLLSLDTQASYHSLQKSVNPQNITSHREFYQSLGIDLFEDRVFSSQGHARKEEDLLFMQEEKEALLEITRALKGTGIPWWVDCGTCLGAYRYGGIIPWDIDIDLAFPLIEFDNVIHALSKLDPDKYLLENWSSRDFPKSYLKLFVRETGNVIDLYFFDVDREKRIFKYILSLETNIFFPTWWKTREQPYKVETSFHTIFPLTKAFFDGIEILMPHNPEKYLQLRYGENLAPVRIWNPKTGQYEKDVSHPYWQRAFVD